MTQETHVIIGNNCAYAIGTVCRKYGWTRCVCGVKMPDGTPVYYVDHLEQIRGLGRLVLYDFTRSPYSPQLLALLAAIRSHPHVVRWAA